MKAGGGSCRWAEGGAGAYIASSLHICPLGAWQCPEESTQGDRAPSSHKHSAEPPLRPASCREAQASLPSAPRLLPFPSRADFSLLPQLRREVPARSPDALRGSAQLLVAPRPGGRCHGRAGAGASLADAGRWACRLRVSLPLSPPGLTGRAQPVVALPLCRSFP